MAARTTRREFFRRSAVLGSLSALGGACAPRVGEKAGGQRPNILLILSDDQGYGDLGCYGGRDLRTPVIDKLATEGVRFTQYYAAGPECTPTRTALMTGRYQQRVGGLECAIGTTNVGRYDDAVRLAEKHDLGLPIQEASLTQALKGAGYTMAVYGKWHLGYEHKFLPLRHGFEHFVGILGGHADYFHYCEITGAKTLYEDDQPTQRTEYMTDLITDESVEFIRRQRGRKPFFLYVAYTAPHSPYQGPNDRSPTRVPRETWNQGTREKYVELVEYMDKGIGKILRALDEKGFAANTLIIFASDNGGTRLASNKPFSGTKGTLYEGGIRVPCIVRWPGVLAKGTVCDEPCITMDLTASIIRAAGAAPGRALDGIDILRHVETRQPVPPRSLLWRARRGERTWRAVRDGSLKYLSRQDGDRVQEWLYDLTKDPGELIDLFANRPADAQRLKRLLADWERSVRHTR